MKEQDKIGILMILILVMFSSLINEIFIDSFKDIILVTIFLIFIPFCQWVAKKQKEIIENEQLKN